MFIPLSNLRKSGIFKKTYQAECVETCFEGCRIKENRYLDGAFDTMEELLCKAESYMSVGKAAKERVIGELPCKTKSGLKNMEMQLYGYITLLQILRSGKSKNLFDFNIFWIDGCWQVKDIWMDDKDMLSCGISKRAINQLSDRCLEHFPLPFEDKSRLKLQMPFMEEAFYGILNSGCGYPGEWHHYLWDENVMASSVNVRGLYTRENMNSCVSLSCMELSNSIYSTLDWLEQA
ncbi:MAG: hypothetical protein HDR12_12495 [Lachnospiraceae bacterium]|nr:hypothetical protein [Lachnospiraceae bacterium]